MTTPILGLVLALVLVALVLVGVRLFRREPETAEDHLRVADGHFENMRFEQAKESCKRALELEPRKAEAYFGLGMCAAMQRRTEEALEWMHRATECDPGHTDAEYALGVGYEELGRLDEAEQHFRRVLDLNPRSADAAAHLVEMLAKVGRATEAEPWQDLAARVESADERDAELLAAEPPPLSDRRALAKLRGTLRARGERAILAGLASAFLASVVVEPLHEAVARQWGLVRVWRQLDLVDRVMAPVAFAAALGFGAAALASVLSLRSQLGRLRNRGHDVKAIVHYLAREHHRTEARGEAAEQAVEQQEHLEFAEASKLASPWWSRELSGAHAVWWVSWIFLWAAITAGEDRSSVVGPVFAVAAMGLLLKAVAPLLPLLLSLLSAVRAPWTWKRRPLLVPIWRDVVSYYRWWGRGWAPVAIALAPGVVYVLLDALVF